MTNIRKFFEYDYGLKESLPDAYGEGNGMVGRLNQMTLGLLTDHRLKIDSLTQEQVKKKMINLLKKKKLRVQLHSIMDALLERSLKSSKESFAASSEKFDHGNEHVSF
jgi:hypothetical protein